MMKVLALALALALAPTAAIAGEATASNGRDAWVLVADEGGVAEPAESLALRTLTIAALRARGVEVADDSRLRDAPADDALCAGAAQEGIRSIFVLRLGGRLAQRIPISLERVSPSECRVVASATLPATGWQEAEKVLPRLAEAVLERKRAESTARRDSVLSKEAEPELRIPVESGFALGFSAPAGISGSFMMEMGHLRLDVSVVGGGGFVQGYSEFMYGGLGVAWVAGDRAVSPYVGGGIGIMGYLDESRETDGAGARFEAGIEFARLHRSRLSVGAEVVMAFFDPAKEGGFADRKRVYPGAYLRLRF